MKSDSRVKLVSGLASFGLTLSAFVVFGEAAGIAVAIACPIMTLCIALSS
jgi:hypothetical protein